MVEVTYRGGNMDGITSNAASEATLLKLLAKMDKALVAVLRVYIIKPKKQARPK